MSSRLSAVLMATVAGAVLCPTTVDAQSPGYPGYAQQRRMARMQPTPAAPPETVDGWPAAGNQAPMQQAPMQQAPMQQAAPAPTADPNFDDETIDGTPYAPQMGAAGACGGGACGYSCAGNSCGGGWDGFGCKWDTGYGTGSDNGWGGLACSQNGACKGYGGWGPRNPMYVRGEYLGWWLKGDNTPALVTTSTPGTTQAQAGILGQPNTSVLYGGNGINNGMRSGARVVAGWWMNPTARLEAEFFGLGTTDANYNQTSSGSPILARPFFNLQTGAQDAAVLAFPAQTQGSVHVVDSSSFLGAGIHATENLSCNDCCCTDKQTRWDVLYGFRYLRLAENLTVNDTFTTAATPGTTFGTFDGFKTANNFYGADLGLMHERRSSRWSLSTTGRLGLGWTSQSATISGNSSVTPAGGSTTTTPGGLLAQPSNIGTYRHDTFTYVPQIELKVGYYVTPSLRLTAGYDLIYWSRVARPGEQINTSVNTSQAGGGTLTGQNGPTFSFHESDLWIQGFSVGGELVF